MADGPQIYPTSYYPAGPLEKFVTGGIEGYGKMLDFQAKSDALSMQLLENAKKRELYASTKADAAQGKIPDAETTANEMAYPGADPSSAGSAGGAKAGETYWTPAGLTALQPTEGKYDQIHYPSGYTKNGVKSSASGGYGFIDSTWQEQASAAGVDINKYPRAYMAPPEVQDAVALKTPIRHWTGVDKNGNPFNAEAQRLAANPAYVTGGAARAAAPAASAAPVASTASAEPALGALDPGAAGPFVTPAPVGGQLPGYPTIRSKEELDRILALPPAAIGAPPAPVARAPGMGLTPGFRPGAPVPRGAQTYYVPPPAAVQPASQYAALVPPQYALIPTTGSGLFGQG